MRHRTEGTTLGATGRDPPAQVPRERVVLDVGLLEMMALLVIALLVFGPDRLPKAAAQAGRTLRDLRRFVASTRADIEKEIGPELKDLKVSDLDPRTFVRRHIVDGIDLGLDDDERPRPRRSTPPRTDGDSPAPYDADAT